MGKNEHKALQELERRKCLEMILNSNAERKLIVAGPGTGKTFTFRKVLEQKAEGVNLAMTFIRRLVHDMEKEVGSYAEVKTFHGYCKKILHEQNVHSELVPYLTKVVEKDAELLGNGLCDFDTKFRSLSEDSPEISFYLARGGYYGAVSFDDSVYRLYKLLQANPNIVPHFDQIVIDEFQDFNPLEVAFIEELQKRGPVLIVGDDDQAIYDRRCASPSFLRGLCESGYYVTFELPFCSRCPEAVVKATNAIIEKAQSCGLMLERRKKRYECYLAAKERDNVRYPKIVVSQCSTAKVLPKYICAEIGKIGPEDIAESHEAGNEYPTVLIVGPKHYLREVAKQLRPVYPQVVYVPSAETTYGPAEGYKQLLRDDKPNLGWRILIEVFQGQEKQEEVVSASEGGIAIRDALDTEFVTAHLLATDIIKRLQNEEAEERDAEKELKGIIGEHCQEVLAFFAKGEEAVDEEMDTTKPTILLTSFLGCKGLSAGHVFIVGANNDSIPKDHNQWTDIEISRFIVALTRTRKQCHILSNKWLFAAKTLQGKWIAEFQRSDFISLIPEELIVDRGYLKAEHFQSLDGR